MPHSLYLGSGIVQSRLKEFDDHHPSNRIQLANLNRERQNQELDIPIDSSASISTAEEKYRPSLRAIRNCLTFSVVELAVSLFTFALFVNSAILITAGASLSNLPADEIKADLFSIHDLLSKSLAPAAGTIFALALLLSGTSAGIVCTMAGQMVSEGQLNWTVRPWVRRLITRSISIIPSIIIAGAVGRSGLSAALEASQVALCVILPFVSAPLIFFTCRAGIMSVWAEPEDPISKKKRITLGDFVELASPSEGRVVGFRNNWLTTGLSVIIWGFIFFMNVALLVLFGIGKSSVDVAATAA
jgi:metal iron transporter